MKRACLIVLFVGCAMVAFPQNAAEKEVIQFERDACKPFVDADVSGLERVLTPDFTLIGSSGEVSTRANEIDELQTGKIHYDVFENFDMKARLYGDNTAVVLGKTHVKGTSGGKPFDRTVQFTDTVVKEDGQWRVAASHVSPVPK